MFEVPGEDSENVIIMIMLHVFLLLSLTENQLISTCKPFKLPECWHGISQPRRERGNVAGFYYENKWNSLLCNKRSHTYTQVGECLQNHNLHFWGDSTLRQWYEYFADSLFRRDDLELHEAENLKFGPHVAFNKRYEINIEYRHHGYPIRNDWTRVGDILYVPNMIDGIVAGDGGNEIVLLSLWAHFTATNLAYYRQRWRAIQYAIARLMTRNPGARVVIKSANTREMVSIDYSNWHAKELDNVMREMMSGLQNVVIIDVWDMTIGHQSGYHIHPGRDVIRQEIDMLISALCSSETK